MIDPVNVKLPTRRVTINLDQDLLAIFKAEALRGGPPYQVAINQALRAYLHSREASEQERAVRVVLTALDDAAVRRKLRSSADGDGAERRALPSVSSADSRCQFSTKVATALGWRTFSTEENALPVARHVEPRLAANVH